MSDKKTQVVINALTKFLNKGGDLSQLKQLANQVSQQIKQQEQSNIVQVTSATRLSKEHQTSISKTLNQQLKGEYTYQFDQDTSLIAGLKIKVNDYILDLSIASTLNQVVETIKK